MLIKNIIDQLREVPGYAGMALYAENEPTFLEGIEPELAGSLLEIFYHGGLRPVTAIIRGFSLVVFSIGDMVAVARIEGRYCKVPAITMKEEDIAIVEPMLCLPSREEARREAEDLLRRFNLIRHE